MKMEDAIRILYSDASLSVAVKPRGILSQADMTGAPAMPEILSEQLKKTVLPVHRLDRAVGGLMVFACSAGAAKFLCREMERGKFVKEYLAVVHGVPESFAGEYHDLLLHNPIQNITQAREHPGRHTKSAALSYEILDKTTAQGEWFSLLRIRLMTGRTHQIRAQLSSRGMPIAGDGKYGAHDHCAPGLWAWRLIFPHPTSGKLLSFSCLPEDGPPWNLFSPDVFPVS